MILKLVILDTGSGADGCKMNVSKTLLILKLKMQLFKNIKDRGTTEKTSDNTGYSITGSRFPIIADKTNCKRSGLNYMMKDDDDDDDDDNNEDYDDDDYD